MTAPAPEKAAPIPADVLALANRIVAAIWFRHGFASDQLNHTIACEIAADRASQEERIREDERDRLLAATGWQNIAAWLESEGAMLPADRARLRGDAS